MVENILQIGLCLPKSCTNEDVKNLVQRLFDAPAVSLKSYNLNATVLEVKNLRFHPRFFLKKSVLILAVLVVLITWLTRSATKLENAIKFDTNNNIALTTETKVELSFLEKVVGCFNYDANKKMILSKEPSKVALKSISGLRWRQIRRRVRPSSSVSFFAGPFRVISLRCRTFAHFSTHRWPIKSATSMEPSRFLGCSCSTQRFSLMGEPEIDIDRSLFCRFLHLSSFFVISGFLATSNLLSDGNRMREIKYNNLLQNARLYAQLLLQRYIRLTPLLILSMLMSLIGSALLNDVSIFWQFCRDDLKCSQWVVLRHSSEFDDEWKCVFRYWWRNALYAQNLFAFDDMCMTWTWSLACDMQFFALTTLVLFAYVR